MLCQVLLGAVELQLHLNRATLKSIQLGFAFVALTLNSLQSGFGQCLLLSCVLELGLSIGSLLLGYSSIALVLVLFNKSYFPLLP